MILETAAKRSLENFPQYIFVLLASTDFRLKLADGNVERTSNKSKEELSIFLIVTSRTTTFLSPPTPVHFMRKVAFSI